MALLRPDRLTISVRVERRRVTQSGYFKIKWQILTKTMNVVDNKRLIGSLQMI